MSLDSVTSRMPGIIAGLQSSTAGFDGKAAYAKSLEAYARQVAAREFMYELRGENDIIELENIVALRDKGALELSKSA